VGDHVQTHTGPYGTGLNPVTHELRGDLLQLEVDLSQAFTRNGAHRREEHMELPEAASIRFVGLLLHTCTAQSGGARIKTAG